MRFRPARTALAAVLALLPSTIALPAAGAQAFSGQQPGLSLPREPVGPADGPDARTDGAKLPQPDAVLPPGWRESSDRAVTLDGDGTGLHVLTAKASNGYAWTTAATLAEPGYDADQWIGQSCVTASGTKAVVVYAPRQFVNKETLFDAGAFAAVVDLTSGKVTKLPERVSLAYHSPGCSTGEDVVLSRFTQPAGGVPTTELLTVDAAAGRVRATTGVPGQLTSAVRYGAGIAAAQGKDLVLVDSAGRTAPLVRGAADDGTPYQLRPEGGGGLAFAVPHGKQADIHRVADGKDTKVLTVGLGEIGLSRTSGGAVLLTGPQATAQTKGRKLPDSWRAVDAAAGSEASTGGELVISSATSGTEAAGAAIGGHAPDTAPPVRITGRSTATGKEFTFRVQPRATDSSGTNASPALGGTAAAPAGSRAPTGSRALAADSTDPGSTPADPDRACAVSRNDPTAQTYQPTPKQVEWAADLAVQNLLPARPGNWTNDGLPAYSPQTLFPQHPLSGGGRVPAQVLLGVLAQETNMWQASSHAPDGIAGNFEQGGYFGNSGTIDQITWANADCGYGISQVTDGMRRTDTQFSALQQKAITVDYAANIAAGLTILEDKWNQTRAAGVTANDGDPKYLENWWFALWAYNTGYHLPGEDNDPNVYGLGWVNNPMNPNYPPDRKMFLSASYDDAKTPNKWSYEERVLGWASTPLLRYDYNDKAYHSAYTRGKWDGGFSPQLGQPTVTLFCDASNNCDPSIQGKPGNPAGATPCTLLSLRCWWHKPVNWTKCSTYCGQEALAFTTVEPRPGATNPYPVDCTTSGLPANAVIVDDVPDSTTGPNSCATPKTWTSRGSLSFAFNPAVQNDRTVYPGKIDLHQIGGGFGGHYWFTHTRSEKVNGSPLTPSDPLVVTGTWTPPQMTGWIRVLVHLPSFGAQTQQATYTVYTGNTDDPSLAVEHRTIPTDHYGQQNAWVDLGVFDFYATPRVELSNLTLDGTGTDDVAWDAMAFSPLPGKPADIVVAMGDSYSSGEGSGSYAAESDNNYGNQSWDACRRSNNSWSRKTVLPGSGSSIGSRTDARDATLDYHSVACSGAVTAQFGSVAGGNVPAYWQQDGGQFWHEADGQFREVSQLQSGFLDSNTTLVTLTVGGNDAGFANVLQKCANPLTSCASQSYEDGIRGTIDGLEVSIKRVLTNIQTLAPHARIVLLGYPQILAAGSECNGLVAQFSSTETSMLGRLAQRFQDDDQAWVSQLRAGGMNVQFVPVIDAFAGHSACWGASGEWINTVVTGPNGQGDNPTVDIDNSNPMCLSATLCVSRESFHPNNGGTQAYANALAAALTGQRG
ncbi:SGNH/GDSL hydrolase family protein [Kitasatospora sp. NPDC088134]|uniref:SGNH/GDSL hydrolase family protein n=1 Tax=Kitasatospora sp. NPDC088134 TaxID=3364071 RepID=UPI0037FD2393